jgi:SAM-dependent methyltransferase
VAASSSVWSARGASYAASPAHSAGPSLSKLLLLAAVKQGDRALDVGTGAGHVAALLACAGATVVGLDSSAGMLDSARSRHGELPGLTFLEAEADASGLESDSFDLVTARHTLHHHRDLAATLSEVQRLLRPGGRFVLVDEVTPHPGVDDWFDALERARDATHVRARSMREWRSMIAGARLGWVVGDDSTRYRLAVAPWLERTGLDVGQRAEVQRLFAQAPRLARELLAIEYDSVTGEALSFEMPMALILAVKPEKGQA